MDCKFFLWDYLKEKSEKAAENPGRPIIMFGTGDGADKILTVMEHYGIKPHCFTMTGDFKSKPDFRGYEVLPLAEIEEKFPPNSANSTQSPIFLLCFGTENPELLERIIELTRKYETYVPDMPVTIGGESAAIHECIYTPDYIEANRKKIEKARKLFEKSPDASKSLEVFDGWLEYRLSGKPEILERIAGKRAEMYELLKIKENEFFIDIGAYNGDTIDEFLEFSGGKFTRIIAVEPDIKNYTDLRRKFYAYGNELLTKVHAAAWNADEPLKFLAKSGKAGSVSLGNNEQGIGNNGQSRRVPGVRTVEVKGVMIDTLCGVDSENSKAAKKPTFIKIDAEGAEKQVLEGAKTVITRHKPKLLLSLYHRAEDMFELPLLLHSFNPRYKFALRKTRCFPGWEFQLIVI